MALAIPSFSPDSINLQRFLRRNAVTQAVLVGKMALVALAGLLLSKLAYDVYSVRALAQKELESFNARLSSSAPSPAPKRAKGPHNYNVIAERAIFGPLGQAAVKAPTTSTKTTKNTAFALIGTFVGTGQDEFAIIEEQKKKTQEVFLLNDSVFGEAQLIGIFSDRVELRRNGEVEVLTLDSTPDASTPIEGGVAQVDADEYAVDEAELDKALENLPLLLTQARAVPFFKEGRAVGLRLFAIRAGSLFEKIGLQNGDVLKSVNGNSLADLSQAMQLFQKLKEERSISVVLERNSAERKFNYEIR